ncbi:MAG: flavin reductase, partial [Treponema sp.]|nr:flavin reductase [Treponema sp.]
TTYNAGIFVSMEALLDDLVAHNIQNRTVAVIENGSWAATSGSLMREKLGKCKNIKIIEQTLSIKSSIKTTQLPELDVMVQAIEKDFPHLIKNDAEKKDNKTASVDPLAMFKLSYGLFVLTAKDGVKDNGCIINTAMQITAAPLRISIAVNKANFTYDMIAKTGEFNISVLAESAPFRIFEQFGFSSGRDTDKFSDNNNVQRTANGIRYLTEYVNSVISGKVSQSYDYGTHTVFFADVTQSFVLAAEPSLTYQYYFDNIKPKPQPAQDKKKGFVCKICGYVHEGDSLLDDFICPLCKHGSVDFEVIN